MLTLCADVTLSQAAGASHAVSGWRHTAKKSSDLEKKKRSSVNRYQCQPQHFASKGMINYLVCFPSDIFLIKKSF